MNRFFSFQKEIPTEFPTSTQPPNGILRLSFFLQSIVRANQAYAYREQFFRQLEPLRHLTESDYFMCYFVNDSGNFTYFQTSSGIRSDCNVPIKPEGDIVGVVGYKKTPIIVHNVENIKEEHPGVDAENPCCDCIKSILSAPIMNTNEECVAVILLYRFGGSSFSKTMLQYVTELCSWAGIAYEKAVKCLRNKSEHKILMKLTECTINCATGVASFVESLQHLMEITSVYLLTQTCFVYDFFKDSFEAVVYKGININNRLCMEKAGIITFKKNSIVRSVMASQKAFNGKLEKGDARIDSQITHILGFEITSLLSIPIIVDGKCVAVAEFINTSRQDGKFTLQDEKDAVVFSVFLSAVMYYNNICILLKQEIARSEVYEEILTYHFKNRSLKYNALALVSTIPEDFHDFTWFPPDESDLLLLINYIFTSSCEKIFTDDRKDSLEEFIRCTKALHRGRLFHNILLSFSTIHFMYCLLKMVPLDFTPYEKVGLLLASYIHGVDHSGFDNYSLKLLGNPLTRMFADNFKVRHCLELGHFLMTRSKLLDHITKEEKQKVMDVFTHTLSNIKYFHDHQDKFLKRVERDFDVSLPHNREMILDLLLWCAVHSRHSKSFVVVKRLCDNFYLESYRLGDIELKAGLTPLPRKDKKLIDRIPMLEVEHLENTVLPCFKALKNLFPLTAKIYEMTCEILKAFKDLVELSGKKVWKPDESIGLTIEEAISI